MRSDASHRTGLEARCLFPLFHSRVFPTNPVANREMADDHSTSTSFFDYYATQSQQQRTIRRL